MFLCLSLRHLPLRNSCWYIGFQIRALQKKKKKKKEEGEEESGKWLSQKISEKSPTQRPTAWQRCGSMSAQLPLELEFYCVSSFKMSSPWGGGTPLGGGVDTVQSMKFAIRRWRLSPDSTMWWLGDLSLSPCISSADGNTASQDCFENQMNIYVRRLYTFSRLKLYTNTGYH